MNQELIIIDTRDRHQSSMPDLIRALPLTQIIECAGKAIQAYAAVKEMEFRSQQQIQAMRSFDTINQSLGQCLVSQNAARMYCITNGKHREAEQVQTVTADTWGKVLAMLGSVTGLLPPGRS